MSSNLDATIFELLPVPAMIVNIDAPAFTLASVNKAAELFLKKEKSSLIGHRLTHIINSADSPHSLEDTLQELLNDRQFHKIAELKFHPGQAGGPQNTYLDISFTPATNADGSLSQVLVTLTDCTEVVALRQHEAATRADLTATKFLADLDHLEKEVLELNSRKEIDIDEVLRVYVQGIEGLFRDMKCSVLRVENNRLYNWASQSLPPAYVASINNLEIGPQNGSCGTAAFLKKRVIVSDIEHDPIWARYKHLALPYGLLACWSYPIIDTEGTVMGVFGVYYNSIKMPGEHELVIIERSASILKVILENRLYAKTIEEVNLLVTQGQELATFGNWQWDIVNNKVTWSPVLYNIYGLDESTFKATFEGYLAMLHPGDRERVKDLILDVLKTHSDVTFEERIIRPDGDIRHLKSWGRVILNDAGDPVRMIGACLDITRAKATETKMEEIAWMQSHVIRAPLARLMGIIDILQDDIVHGVQKDELLTDMLNSAYELDNIIRNISGKTEK